jgi:hypothetical protein
MNYRVLTRTPIRRPMLRGEAVELVRSDDALMHTAILLAANHWVLLGGNPATVSSALYHHKLEAIRIINERLDDPAKAGLVGTVGAVAAMTLAEVSNNLTLRNSLSAKLQILGQLWQYRSSNSSSEWLRASSKVRRSFALEKYEWNDPQNDSTVSSSALKNDAVMKIVTQLIIRTAPTH